MGIYLDFAAATPVDTEVMAAMMPYFSENFYNPSSQYQPAVQVGRDLESARAKVASVLGAKTPEIIFTAGATEANNLAINGIMQQYPNSHLVYSAIEHDSVLAPSGKYNSSILPIDESGIIQLDKLKEIITDDTVLVSVMYANNEIGTVQPIRKISRIISEVRKTRVRNGNKSPLYLHTDAAQAGNYLDMHVHRLGADLMVINGGKLYGPKQSGVLYVRTGVTLQPQICGGGQERGIRSGTENVAGAIGLSVALSKSVSMRSSETERLRLLQQEFISKLKEKIPEAIVNGSLKNRLPNNLHITLPGQDNERVLMALDMENIYAAAGSACSASHDAPSHVLSALGMKDKEIRSSIRISMGRQTTLAEVNETIVTLSRILA